MFKEFPFTNDNKFLAPNCFAGQKARISTLYRSSLDKASSSSFDLPIAVLEFVNPKYKDDKVRMEFKKPTRLECMMQDRPKLFQKEMGSKARIGFTMFDWWFTFSPTKVSV